MWKVVKFKMTNQQPSNACNMNIFYNKIPSFLKSKPEIDSLNALKHFIKFILYYLLVIWHIVQISLLINILSYQSELY